MRAKELVGEPLVQALGQSKLSLNHMQKQGSPVPLLALSLFIGRHRDHVLLPQEVIFRDRSGPFSLPGNRGINRRLMTSF